MVSPRPWACYLTLGCPVLLLAFGCGGGPRMPVPAEAGDAAEPVIELPDSAPEAPGDENQQADPDESASTSPSSKPAGDSQDKLVALAAAPDTSGEWGTLRGRFVYDGPAPVQKKLRVDKDVSICTKHHPLDESLIVNKENGGLADVVVWLYLRRGEKIDKVHPSYDETAEARVELNNEFCRFEPRITLLRTTQTLVLGNKDATGHNSKVTTFNNQEINPIIPSGGTYEKQFPTAERLPVPISCNIHPWMRAYLVIKDDPYFAVTDKDGRFEIKNLPVGEWTFRFWHTKYVRDVTLAGGKKTDRGGRVEIDILPGDTKNDQGEIKVSPSFFKS